MLYQNEKKLLFIIRYMPLLFILVLSILITVAIEFFNKTTIEYNITETTNVYIKFHNEEIKNQVYQVYDYIKNEKENSINSLKEFIKERTYEAHAIASKIYEDNKETKTKEEIFELIKTAIGSIIYNKGRGYFFIDSAKGVGLLQPLNKELENVDKLEFKDAKGYQFVKTIVKTIKDKTERYDTYYWYKAGDKDRAYKKISFYKYFEPLDFAIGTGDYLDDYVAELKQRIIKYVQNIKLKKDGYIFLSEYSGKVLSSDVKNNIGKNIFNIDDKNKFKLIQEVIKTSQGAEGFVSYLSSTLGKQSHKKTSFVKSFPEWQWIIGTGYNDKNLSDIIAEETEKFNIKYSEIFNLILIISVIGTLILLSISIIMSKILEKRFVEYRNKIKSEEMEFRNLFQNSAVGLAISDTNGKFIKVNDKFVDILGYSSPEDFLDKSWKDISHNDFTQEESKTFDDLKSKKISKYSIEKVYVKEDGTVFDAYLSANAFSIENKMKYVLSSLIDITEIKTKDNLLFQQSKMASMGEMLANIAHQWRQPLSTISTASSGLKLQKEYGLLTDDNLISSLDTITASSKYLSQTIEDFRAFFSPSKERVFIKTEDIVSQTLNLISTQFKNKDITIIEDIESIEIESLKNELIQVLINILNNASDALEAKSHDKFIFINIKKDKNNVVISIKDNAGGIHKNIVNRIFEPYFTTKHKAQGTGIGLYMVDEIIKKHINGKIKVRNVNYSYHSKFYTGAEFKIYIPIYENHKDIKIEK